MHITRLQFVFFSLFTLGVLSACHKDRRENPIIEDSSPSCCAPAPEFLCSDFINVDVGSLESLQWWASGQVPITNLSFYPIACVITGIPGEFDSTVAGTYGVEPYIVAALSTQPITFHFTSGENLAFDPTFGDGMMITCTDENGRSVVHSWHFATKNCVDL